jgi:two-component system sensor histidine kinase UhpB
MPLRARRQRSTLTRVVSVNAGVILIGAVGGTLVTRAFPDTPVGLLIAGYFICGAALMAIANFIVLRRAFRPLLELSRAMASINRAEVDQPLPAESSQDTDLQPVSRAVRDMLDRIAGESRAYKAKVFESIEDDRRRIGRELHDETSQSLAAALLNLDMVRSEATVEGAQGLERLANARDIIHHCLGQLRLLVYDLRPSMLDDFGLAPAVRWYVETHLQASGLRVITDIDGIEARLPATMETALYRICQESLANVVKHAGATRVVLHITATGEHVSLTVSDNGVGFDPKAETHAGNGHSGVGLLSIRERAEALDGTLTVYSVRDRGTQIQVLIPLPTEAQGA